MNTVKDSLARGMFVVTRELIVVVHMMRRDQRQL